MKVKCVLVNVSAAQAKVFQMKLTLQIPQATVHSSLVADAWLAWHSMPT
jgi:hypothetical protein